LKIYKFYLNFFFFLFCGLQIEFFCFLGHDSVLVANDNGPGHVQPAFFADARMVERHKTGSARA
jgi:hypothetical protein